MAGQLRVDEITNEAGTGSPSFPNGVAASTATTATTAGSITGTTTAAIPDGALASGTANNTTFLRGDRTWGIVDTAAGVVALEGVKLEIVSTTTFNSSGTWTKPTGLDETLHTIVALVISGGGGGGSCRTGGSTFTNAAATGGSFTGVLYGLALNSLPSSLSVTVGAGGVGTTANSSGDTRTGTNGGGSSFGSFVSGAAAGGQVALQSTFQTATGILNTDDSFFSFNISQAGRQIFSSGGAGVQPFWGAGGSNGHVSNTQNTTGRTGGPAIGTFIGAGGSGGQSTGGNGAAPGGGGGGATNHEANATGGNGAAGRVIVLLCKGAAIPQDFFRRRIL